MSRDVAARREEGVRMGGVASAFTAADGSRKKAFIPFVTCGDPSIGLTEQVVRAMERAGADLIELGIPFSDPTAEGPTIREANVRALKTMSPPTRSSIWWRDFARGASGSLWSS